MKPSRNSEQLLGVTRAKAKMFEYGIDDEHHIKLPKDPARLFSLTIGLLGEYSAEVNRGTLNDEQENELKRDLQFAAYFFDSYLQSHLDIELEPYLVILGSAAYYLCDIPGSSNVLASKLDVSPNLGAFGLESLLHWLLKGEFGKPLQIQGIHAHMVNAIRTAFVFFWESGENSEYIELKCQELRKHTYLNGSPRELLISDVIFSVARKRIKNSCWSSLPTYTGLSEKDWRTAIQKKQFIKELWPAQHLLGQKGIFAGESGVVQMPTSAGKTKAIEIIIRTAFITNRTSLAVIVAPYRALCHEIKNNLHYSFIEEDVKVNEMTDVPIFDFDLDTLIGRQVLIVTPEKLLYVLRHQPELSDEIGVLIYDEGHQFDNDSRGITYELLLTSLKSMIREATQVVLISAVISNATAIGDWLIGEGSTNVDGTLLTPTFRTLAFSSWTQQLGRLNFVSNQNPEERVFFVPRIIEQLQLKLLGKERKKRLFPEKDDSQAIALFLALKVVHNGTVAIFVGRKSSATNVGEKLIDIFKREVSLTEPRLFSDEIEVDKLTRLIELNMGIDAIETNCSKLGVYLHHGNVPQGIRLAVEHALKEDKVKFVICTSTLAQGVNLPLRYLIVTSLYQGNKKIKIRDFHNLMGRAGRSGMHTEGSIIFADPEVYDKRKTRDKNWKWKQSQEALNPSNSEPCESTLLSILEPLQSDDRRFIIDFEMMKIVQTYYDSLDEFKELIEGIAAVDGFSLSGVQRQLSDKISIIASVESFIMTHWSTQDYEVDTVLALAERTLAYYLANDSQKETLIALFKTIARNVHNKVESHEQKLVFGKTLYGLEKTLKILEWLQNNIHSLLLCTNLDELLDRTWPMMYEIIDNSTFNKCDPPEFLRVLCSQWVRGDSYTELLEVSRSEGAVIGGKRPRPLKMEDIVEICDNSLSYEGTLFLGAVLELLTIVEDVTSDTLNELIEEFQKKLRYGLPSRKAVIIYELGFSDRVIAQQISTLTGVSGSHKNDLINQLKDNGEGIKTLLAKFPAYFQMILQQYIS